MTGLVCWRSSWTMAGVSFCFFYFFQSSLTLVGSVTRTQVVSGPSSSELEQMLGGSMLIQNYNRYQNNHTIIPSYQFYLMISQKLDALNRAIQSLDRDKLQTNIELDSIALISQNTARPKRTISTPLKKSSIKKNHPSFFTDFPQMPKKLKQLIKSLYDSRCDDLRLQYNESSWQAFVQSYVRKNKNPQFLDLSSLNLGARANKIINEIIINYRNIDLSRNYISCFKLQSLKQCKEIKELILSNCNLKNQELQFLFQMLLQTPIKALTLSSPDLKDRNQLTKYDKLYQLMKKSQTLKVLGLSNIQIVPQNEIFIQSKDTSLESIDLSKNTDVAGMNKTLFDINLSWNNISDPQPLRCPNTQLMKFNITGNPIPIYKFETFLTVDHYRNVKHLILNDIPFNQEAMFLQEFLEKSSSLLHLQMINCEISKPAFLNLAYGLENNHYLKILNISKNKFPIKGVDDALAYSFARSKLVELIMCECDIKDECGEILLAKLCMSKLITKVDMSKNALGWKTSVILCEMLKTKCYNLLALNISQNFIKYDHIKEIEDYIDRNVFMEKSHIREQYKKFKEIRFNEGQIEEQILQTRKAKKLLQTENLEVRRNYLEKKRQYNKLQKSLIEEEVALIRKEEELLKEKIESLMRDIENLSVSQQSNERLQTE